MKPEDVPESLVDLFRTGAPVPKYGVRAGLAKVLPEYEKQVQARFAAEFEVVLQEMREDGNVDLRTPIHMLRDIARGNR